MKISTIHLACVVFLPWLVYADSNADWLAWRGPTGNGIAAPGQTPVTAWSETKNILWKADVPGRGHSTPIVVGDLVVVTTADKAAETQSILTFDRKSGASSWSQVIHRGGLPKEMNKKNSHATPTVASDGSRLYAVFCNSDSVRLTALDLNGHILWTINAGAYAPLKFNSGYAPSPLIYGGNVIVASDFEDGFVAAFKKSNGKEAWRTPRPSKNVSYSSPIIGNVAGRDQLLISGDEKVSSYDPQGGKLLWVAAGTTKANCGTMVWEGDAVFASGGFPKSETIAIRADGSKEVLWKNSNKCFVPSMLVHEGHLYAVNDNGIAICWRARDGREMWKERLQGPMSPSPILAAGNIYSSNEKGTTFVFKADPERYVEVARNQLGDESFASRTICGGRIYLRHASRTEGSRKETLYCIGTE